MDTFLSRTTLLFCVLLCIIFLSGCGERMNASAVPATDADLASRIHLYNTSRLENDAKTLYALHWSGYRNVVSLERFLSRPSNITILNYSLEELRYVDEQHASAIVITDFSVMGMVFHGRREEQQWILENGQWYIKISPTISTPFGPAPLQKTP